MSKPKAIFILARDSYEVIFGKRLSKEIEKYVEFVSPPLTSHQVADKLDILQNVDIIFSGWGAPLMDEKFLSAAPQLKAVFYGAGSIRSFITDAFWKRDILLTHAAHENAIPVSQFTLAQIIFCLNQVWDLSKQMKQQKVTRVSKGAIVGGYRSLVGIVGFGATGSRVAELVNLTLPGVEVIACDPYANADVAKKLGVRLGSLEEVFEESDVITLHAPNLPETKHMIRGEHFEKMKKNSSFINTARGRIIDEEALIEVFKERTDLTACLDVTFPEPPREDSPLYEMENVILTPHIAGSNGRECQRMGEAALAELELYMAGKEPNHPITKEIMGHMA